MLSNLLITKQKFVLIIDELGQEKLANKILCQLLREQGQDESNIKTLPTSAALKDEASYDAFVADCCVNQDQKFNVLLPTLSDLLCYQRPAVIFQFVQNLKRCPQVKRTFLWASTIHLVEKEIRFLIPCFEYMADLIMHLHTSVELSIVTRKPGGGVSNKRYTCQRTKDLFLVEPMKSVEKRAEDPKPKPEQLGTFKIDLEEDELVARNALKLPYEKTTEGNIIYLPDAVDDFDDEDPDEDLCI